MDNMTKEEALNILIKGSDTNQISDGYHTFGELYEHRITLFITLARWIDNMVQFGSVNEHSSYKVWKSRKHSDGSSYEGWFVLGIGTEKGQQITYHLPDKYWGLTEFADGLLTAPEFDGHTSKDVLERIMTL
jgi:hypothetical protein